MRDVHSRLFLARWAAHLRGYGEVDQRLVEQPGRPRGREPGVRFFGATCWRDSRRTADDDDDEQQQQRENRHHGNTTGDRHDPLMINVRISQS